MKLQGMQMLELVYIFYQEALHKFLFLSHVDSSIAWLQSEIDTDEG